MKNHHAGITAFLAVTAASLLLVMLTAGCTRNEGLSDPAAPETGGTLFKGKVIHHVSVGGPDILGPGGDANYSLVANMDAEGNVTGQWEDVLKNSDGNIHVAVDCMTISGNQAIIGGVITHGTLGGVDVSGQRAVTMVEDNGVSANDPPDRISYSYFPVGGVCGNYSFAVFPLFDVPQGQVTIR